MAKKNDPRLRVPFASLASFPPTNFNDIARTSPPTRPSREPPNVQRARREVKKMQAETYRKDQGK